MLHNSSHTNTECDRLIAMEYLKCMPPAICTVCTVIDLRLGMNLFVMTIL